MSEVREKLGLPEQGAQRVYSSRNGQKRAPKREKKEGHDELIARLAPVGTRIWLFLRSGDEVVGILKGSDRFTITVGNAVWNDIEVTDESSPVLLVYKHSIEAFKLRIEGDNTER